MTEIQKNKTVVRLTKYLEVVNSNLKASLFPEVKEFWKRELKKTTSKIASLK